MIVHLPSVLTRDVFLARHPVPHVIVGHLDQPEAREEEADLRDEPGYFSSLTWAVAALGLAGDCTVRMLEDWSTVWLAFAREGDAARVRALVGALSEVPVRHESASVATFIFDRTLHDRLLAIRDRRIADIERAFLTGEGVTYVHIDGVPLEFEPGPLADDWGAAGPTWHTEGDFPLGDADG